MNTQSQFEDVSFKSVQPAGASVQNSFSANPVNRDRAVWIFLVTVCLALSLFTVYRAFWISRFDSVLSDPVDGRFSISILEHWTRVFHAQSPLASPNFFYPQQGMLGFSEAFFLLAVPFASLKAVGLDRYLAFQITMMLQTAIGFISMLYVLRFVLAFGRMISLLGAILFVTFNMYYIHIVHPQLASVIYVPVLVLMAFRYCKSIESHPGLCRIYISSMAVLLALLFFTSFYVGWFAGIFGCAVSTVFLGLQVILERQIRPVIGVISAAYRQKWNLAIGATFFLLTLIPFLTIYLPALRHTGTRGFGESLYYMPSPWGAFDVGRDNGVWGRVAAKVESLVGPGGLHEHPAGWPFTTLLLFASSGLWASIRLFRGSARENCRERLQLCWITALAITCIALWTAGIRMGNHAPMWALFWKFVPGAKAIRVPPRINLILNFGIIIVCMFGLEALIKTVPRWRLLGFIVALLLAFALFAEQINFMPTHLISRTVEWQKFSKISPPPKACTEFYVSTRSDKRWATLTFQTDAMLIAEQFGIPTINGYSGWFPAGWNFLTEPSEPVAEKARCWATTHDITTGLCGLDVASGEWSTVDLRDRPSCASVLQSSPIRAVR